MWRHGKVEHGWKHKDAVVAIIAFPSALIAEMVTCMTAVIEKWHCMNVYVCECGWGVLVSQHVCICNTVHVVEDHPYQPFGIVVTHKLIQGGV